jgi:two-component system aerobic respiration control sensor histidine kinase ArcB
MNLKNIVLLQKIEKDETYLLTNIIENLPGSIYCKDENGVYLYVNRESIISLQKFNFPLDFNEVIGKTDYELFPTDMADIFHNNDLAVMESGEKIAYEEPILPNKLHGQSIQLSIKAPLLDKNNKIRGVIGNTIDITYLKNQLQEANKIIIAKNLAQAQFIQNMQHDFRTPASGAWSMLNNLAEAETDPEKKNLLTLVRDANKQIYDICNEIVDFNKIERIATPVLSKKFNIETTIKNVLELHRPAAFIKKLFLDYNIDPNLPAVIRGDEYRINRILINLVANAIKFTKTGGVSVAAKLGKISSRDIIVQLEITDTGIGIPVDKQMVIYERFNRLTPSNAGFYKGAGLGLRIVKQFLEELDGEIEVQSEINKGSTFYITCPFRLPLLDTIHHVLPINPQGAELVDASRVEYSVNHSLEIKSDVPHILLIEDNQLARLGAVKSLKVANCIVSEAENVSQARKLLSNTKFDLVISDLGLPDGSGNDIVLEVKANQQALNYNTPFLALTAHNDTANVAEAKNAGFLLIMVKPLLEEQVPELIGSYVPNKGRIVRGGA